MSPEWLYYQSSNIAGKFVLFSREFWDMFQPKIHTFPTGSTSIWSNYSDLFPTILNSGLGIIVYHLPRSIQSACWTFRRMPRLPSFFFPSQEPTLDKTHTLQAHFPATGACWMLRHQMKFSFQKIRSSIHVTRRAI